jgi:hypothetical protein
MKATEFNQHALLGDDYWGSNERYTLAEWQCDVANDDTRLGYWDWVVEKSGI